MRDEQRQLLHSDAQARAFRATAGFDRLNRELSCDLGGKLDKTLPDQGLAGALGPSQDKCSNNSSSNTSAATAAAASKMQVH